MSEENAKGRKVLCAIMMDEMAIKKHIEYDGKKFCGHVNVGADSGIEPDANKLASEALVLMVTALNGQWKVPIAYFLVHGLTGSERANLIRLCLSKLHDVGVQVVSLTCDGPSVHWTMLKALGADLSVTGMRSSFPHPSTDAPVQVLLDCVHMIKLVRNSFAALGSLKDVDGERIEWRFIEELEKLQSEEGLRAGNKLRKAHLQFRKMKMKVSLAVQLLSASVASAIEFCDKDLGLPQFKGSEATVRFIRLFDRLFDWCNSRSPFGRGYKAALRPSNEAYWKAFLSEAAAYIKGLTDVKGVPLHETRKKTPFIGFLLAMQSIRNVFEECVSGGDLKYLLTYKMSQDHLELFFCAVRSGLGANNNPTARQFEGVYKKLLIRHEIKHLNGNCFSQDGTVTLFTDSKLRKAGMFVEVANGNSNGQLPLCDAYVSVLYPFVSFLGTEVDASDVSLCKQLGQEPTQIDHDYADMPPYVPCISQYKEASISYIAGYVIRMVKKKTPCEQCQDALVDAEKRQGGNMSLVARKDNGGLLYPAQDFIDVCLEAERVFLQVQHQALTMQPNLQHRIASTVLENISSKKS